MKMNKKGFTLAELLIVVAIIAVLAAVAIPVFKGSTDNAALSADVANIRVAYAEIQTNALDSSVAIENDTFKAQSAAVFTAGSKTATFNTKTAELPAPAAAATTLTKGTSYQVGVNGSGQLTFTAV